MFIAALFIIAKTWKQPRCPIIYEWIVNCGTTRQWEYYSALQRNELSSHEKTWRNIKCIFENERNLPEKATYCMIPTI